MHVPSEKEVIWSSVVEGGCILFQTTSQQAIKTYYNKRKEEEEKEKKKASAREWKSALMQSSALIRLIQQ